MQHKPSSIGLICLVSLLVALSGCKSDRNGPDLGLQDLNQTLDLNTLDLSDVHTADGPRTKPKSDVVKPKSDGKTPPDKPPVKAVCGDGKCNGGETCFNCVEDCSPCCGDDECNGGETCDTCAVDCDCCGSGVCEKGETECSCPKDCGWCKGCCKAGSDACKAGTVADECGKNGSYCATCPYGKSCQEGKCACECGDGLCGCVENCDTCPEDCDTCCGQGGCQAKYGEDTCTCPEDCGPPCTFKQCGPDPCGGASCGTCPSYAYCDAEGQCQPKCGNEVCDVGETCSSCSFDCGICPYCGDQTCDETEACGDCPADCGECCPNSLCDNGETCETCPADCGGCPGVCDDVCGLELEECLEFAGLPVCVPKMVKIPAGTFWMGCNDPADPDEESDCEPDSYPYHEVALWDYSIDITEVTNEQYAFFLDWLQANGQPNLCMGQPCVDVAAAEELQVEKTETGWSAKAGKELTPVVEVTWYGGQAYCQWRCPTCGLCTEAQWEKAARGGCAWYETKEADCNLDSYDYPWGQQTPSCVYAVTYGVGGPGCGNGGPLNGCSRSPKGDSPYGLCDMAGNVWEWVFDRYQQDYYCDGPDATGDEPCAMDSTWPGSPKAWSGPTGPEGGEFRVLRGGSLNFICPACLGVSHRSHDYPAGSLDLVGFRCCSTSVN